MELQKLKVKLTAAVTKYKFVILILILGLILILLPTGKTADPPKTQTVTDDKHIDQEALGALLSRMKGAGRVEVLLSTQDSFLTQYQENRDITSPASRSTTVTVTDSQRNETGLINKTSAPTYRGAIIVCDGADDPAVRLALVEAVSNITGLRTNQISVLKRN